MRTKYNFEGTHPKFHQPEIVVKPKSIWLKLLERVVIFGLGLIIKNQKGIKGTPNETKVDKVLDNL